MGDLSFGFRWVWAGMKLGDRRFYIFGDIYRAMVKLRKNGRFGNKSYIKRSILTLTSHYFYDFFIKAKPYTSIIITIPS